MSLRLWMPLMGDLRNQGLDNFNMSTLGTISWVDGKLGTKALQAGNANQTSNGISINSNLTDILAEEYSISVWVKPLGNHVHYNGTILSSGDWNHTRWTFGVNQDNTKVDVLSNRHNVYLNCTVPVNEWTHLVCTCDSSNKVHLYKNGEYIGYTTLSEKPSSDANNTTIGRETYASGYFSFNGVIQDLRLYDHCLSEMEVKQLSQGLILHYPLNRNGFGQENLITQTMIDAEPWKSAISGSYTIDGKTGWILSNSQLYSKSGNGVNNIFSGLTYEANTQYTISFKWRDDYRTDGKSSSLYIRFKYSDGTYTQVICPKCDYWKEEVMTSSAGKTVSAITTTYGNGGNLLFADLKLEKGTIKTPTSPIVDSDLYNSMGLNSTIEYDCSGFCNNGTKIDTFNWTSDTPKYAVSTIFSGTNYIRTTTPGADILTLSCWVKTSKNKSTSQIMVADSTSQLCISFYSGTIISFYASSGYSTGSKCTLGSAYKENDWNHLVVVKTGTGTRKVYCNGVEQTATSNDYWASSSVGFTVARRETSTPHAFYGELCDVRAYATALSPSDVKSLYQNCATIDPDGTIRGQIRS